MWIAFKIDFILLPLYIVVTGLVKIVVFLTVNLIKLGLWLLEVSITGIIRATPYMMRGLQRLWRKGRNGMVNYRHRGL